MVHNETGETETICLANDILGPDGDSFTEDEVDHLNMLLLVKDQYNVSEHYKIKARIKKLNWLWTIKLTPNGTVGVQQSLRERLSCRISRLCKVSPPSSQFRASHNIRVKLSGDGTWIGK